MQLRELPNSWMIQLNLFFSLRSEKNTSNFLYYFSGSGQTSATPPGRQCFFHSAGCFFHSGVKKTLAGFCIIFQDPVTRHPAGQGRGHALVNCGRHYVRGSCAGQRRLTGQPWPECFFHSAQCFFHSGVKKTLADSCIIFLILATTVCQNLLCLWPAAMAFL